VVHHGHVVIKYKSSIIGLCQMLIISNYELGLFYMDEVNM
jgi:hypothetical protein